MIASQTTEDQFTCPGFSPAKLNRWRYFIGSVILCFIFSLVRFISSNRVTGLGPPSYAGIQVRTMLTAVKSDVRHSGMWAMPLSVSSPMLILPLQPACLMIEIFSHYYFFWGFCMWNLQLVRPCLPLHSLHAHTESSHYAVLYFKCPVPFLSATAVCQNAVLTMA